MIKGKVTTQQDQIDELHEILDEILALNYKMVEALKIHQELIDKMGFVVLQTDNEG